MAGSGFGTSEAVPQWPGGHSVPETVTLVPTVSFVDDTSRLPFTGTVVVVVVGNATVTGTTDEVGDGVERGVAVVGEHAVAKARMSSDATATYGQSRATGMPPEYALPPRVTVDAGSRTTTERQIVLPRG